MSTDSCDLSSSEMRNFGDPNFEDQRQRFQIAEFQAEFLIKCEIQVTVAAGIRSS